MDKVTSDAYVQHAKILTFCLSWMAHPGASAWHRKAQYRCGICTESVWGASARLWRLCHRCRMWLYPAGNPLPWSPLEEHLCLVHGKETQVRWADDLWDAKSALLVDWKQYVSIRSIILCPSFRVEETWRLWQKFLDDFAHFEEWLATSEKATAQPNSSGVLYTVAKEELKKFEVLQKSFLFIINCWTAINEACFYVDFPEASPRKPNPVRINQQAIPPPGQRKPHWLLLSSEGNGSQCQPAMGQPPDEDGLNPPQAQSTINSFSLYSNGRCAFLTESTSPHTLQPYVPFVVTATVRAACLFHFYSTLLIKERSLRLPEMVFWCGWQRWTYSWPTSSTSQSVTFRPKSNNSGWVCHILIRVLFWPWKQN